MNEVTPGQPVPRWAVVVLLAASLGLAGLAALGAREVPGVGTSRGIAEDLSWNPRMILSLLVLGLLGFVAYMILTSPRGRLEVRGGGRQRTKPLATFIVLAVFAAVVLFIASPNERDDGGLEVGIPGEGSLAEAPPAQEPGSLLGLVLFTVALIGTSVGLTYVARRRGGPLEQPDVRGILSSVDTAIQELELGGEPRQIVIAAFANMEAAFARAGVARGRHEAPLEFVSRSLTTLRVNEEAIGRLAQLFGEARFSSHSIDDDMAKAAIEALSGIRSDLEPA